MNVKLLAAIAVLVVGGAGIVFIARSRAHSRQQPTRTVPSGKPSEHGDGMDQSMAAVRAMYSAPTGATPCESAYNAFQASLDVSNNTGAKPVIKKLAPHDDFIPRCQALPSLVQQCLVPLYLAQNRPQCEKVKPDRAVLNEMVEIQSLTEQNLETNEPP
jgi:hypothetical protein